MGMQLGMSLAEQLFSKKSYGLNKIKKPLNNF